MKTVKFPYLSFTIPLALVLSLFILVRTPLFQANPESLSIAITLDLLLSIPFVYYLIIRKKAIPKITVVSVFMGCLALAHFILPPSQQTFLSQLEFWLFPLAEFFVLSFVIISASKTIRQFKIQKKAIPDFFTALCTACKAALPMRIAMVMATEIAVVYYSLFAWTTKKIKRTNEFTYYKKSGIIAAVYAFMLIILAETFAVHMAVERWNATVAWVLSAFSLYTCVQLFALIRSMPKRLTFIDEEDGKLHLRFGFFSETTIAIKDIQNIQLTTRTLPEDGSVVQFSPLGGLDNHNMILHLDSTMTLNKIYGLQKDFRSLAIYIDEKELFVEQIKQLKKT